MAERFNREEASPTPDFTTLDSEGNKISLSDFKGEKTVVLVFNRGFG
jgi:peroxiredoxin